LLAGDPANASSSAHFEASENAYFQVQSGDAIGISESITIAV
jgi:hypothetical protein